MSKAILILSGGMDSTTLLYRLLKEGHEVLCLSFNYGQRHKKELQYAKRICKNLNVKHKTINISNLIGLLKGSSLTDNIDVPEGHYQEESMKSTVVPNRNMIMLAIAGAYAVSQKAELLAIGVHAGDHAIYPDCRPEFIETFQRALIAGNYTPVTLYTPYLTLTKGDIAKEGKILGVNYALTWTCYKGEETPCGKCGACMERAEALEFANNVITSDQLNEATNG